MSGPAEDWLSEAELHAHLDGELEAERCAAVEAFLAAPSRGGGARAELPSARLPVARAYGPLLDRPVPTSVAAATQLPAAPRPGRLALARGRRVRGPAPARRRRRLGLVAARSLRPISAQAESFVADAMSAHLVYAVEVRHPVEVGANDETHLLTWLSRRLGSTADRARSRRPGLRSDRRPAVAGEHRAGGAVHVSGPERAPPDPLHAGPAPSPARPPSGSSTRASSPRSTGARRAPPGRCSASCRGRAAPRRPCRLPGAQL